MTYPRIASFQPLMICYCGYGFRIVFIIEKHIDDELLENRTLLDVGERGDFY